MTKVKFKLRPIQDFFQAMLLMLGLVVVALVSALTTMHFAIHGREVKVPGLKGMTVAEARSQTAGLGLNLEVEDRFYSADVAAGHILSQSPALGAVVRREWQVRVAESLGPQKVEVPNVVGGQERTAALNLRRAGLEAGLMARLPDTSVSPGTVLAQDPPPKAQGIERPSVSLLIAASDDAPPDGFVMPDLTGLPVITAQAALTRVGIKFGEPKFVDVPMAPVTGPGAAGSGTTPTVKAALPAGAPTAATPSAPPAPIHGTALPGVVTAQSPPAGYRVDVGSTVALTVAK
jgi:beta-lactam-binding protein with PASTA domain